MSGRRPFGWVGWRTRGVLIVAAVVGAAGAGPGTVNAAGGAPIVMSATVTVSGAVNATYRVRETEVQLEQDHDCILTSNAFYRGDPNSVSVGLGHNVSVNAGGFRGKTTRLPHGFLVNALFTKGRRQWQAGEGFYYGPRNAARYKRIGSGKVWFASDGKSGGFDFSSPGTVAHSGRTITKQGRIHAHGSWSCQTVMIETH
jgi:hypothetical protein